jgi:serine/threonine-protein kinase RsbT
MHGLNVLQKTQQSERSRQWASWPTVRVRIETDADIVLARQQSKVLATALQFSPTDSAFIATTVSELARALLSHTVRGEIWLHKVHEDDRNGVVIVARDPVGADPRLPEVFRLVDEFDVASEAGRGTTIRAAKWCRRHSRVAGG